MALVFNNAADMPCSILLINKNNKNKISTIVYSRMFIQLFACIAFVFQIIEQEKRITVGINEYQIMIV